MNPIRFIEEREGIRDWELADVLGVSESVISKYKNNKRKLGHKPLKMIMRKFPKYGGEILIYLRDGDD